MPMILTPLTIFLSISTLAYLMRVSLLKLSKVKLLTLSGNLGLQRAYLGQSIRKISYISNTFGIDQMKNFSNTKRMKILTDPLRLAKRL